MTWFYKKKSHAVGRTSSQSPFHCLAMGSWGGASSAFARLCPNQLPVYNNQAVHAVRVACRVRSKIALSQSQSPRVPESPQNLGHGENTQRSLFFAFGAAQSCRCWILHLKVVFPCQAGLNTVSRLLLLVLCSCVPAAAKVVNTNVAIWSLCLLPTVPRRQPRRWRPLTSQSGSARNPLG